MELSLIITVVNRGYAEAVMDAGRAKGARGGTIINGRGTGAEHAKQFFNLVIEAEKELVLIIAPSDKCGEIMENIRLLVGLNTNGKGIAFSLPVEEAVGLNI
ncbi:MAG: P-II family nitrogen regulator [Clostridia bacterium]